MRNFYKIMNPKNYYLIISPPENAATNMALDEALLLKESNLPILRLYTWENPAFSLGRFQNATEVLNTELCLEYDVEIVKRFTGGGCIFHDQELTYSLTWPTSFFEKKLTVKESYKVLTSFLLDFYQSLGLTGIGFNNQDQILSHNFCFMGFEKYDFFINGYKLGGNAQKRTKNNIFIHGSIPITFDLSLCNTLLKCKINKTKPFTNLTELGIKANLNELKTTLIKSFEKIFGLVAVKYEI